MPCLNPIDAWRTPEGIAFKSPKGASSKLDPPMQFPCRNCVGCKVDRSKEWAVRCMHEASMHQDNMFITLTYNEENLPEDRGLNHDHFKEFMKRLRDNVKYVNGKKIKYYMCGEYGEEFHRPHYHAIIFGHRMDDCKKMGKYWHSPKLEKLWGKGFVSIGNVTMESCSYVARYIMKKITGDQAEDHYKREYLDIETQTFETITVKPEYNSMSLRPAIGKEWYEKYGKDIKENEIHINGKTYYMPKYYLRILEKQDPERYREITQQREEHAKKNPSDKNKLEALRHKYKHNFKNERKLK